MKSKESIMKRTHIIGVICGVLFTAVVNTNISYARSKQAAEDMVPRSEYEKLKQEVEALKSQVRMLMEHESWVRQAVAQPEADKKQEAEAVAKVAEPKQDDKATAARAETASASSAPKKVSPEMGLQEGDREKEAEEAKIELDQFLRSQKVLFKKGDLQIEFSASYAQDTAEISPYKLRAKTAGAGVLFRYGLIDDLELDISVPFTFQELELDTRSSLAEDIGFARQDGSGLGDVSGSLRWGALHEEGLVPETTLSLNVKSDSGREGRGLTPILGPSNLVAFGLDPSLGTGFGISAVPCLWSRQ